jgi:hypothetical protein
MERINILNAGKIHEEEMHEKFLRLRERSDKDHDRLLECIKVYRRYLDIRFKQRRDATVLARAMTLDEDTLCKQINPLKVTDALPNVNVLVWSTPRTVSCSVMSPCKSSSKALPIFASMRASFTSSEPWAASAEPIF